MPNIEAIEALALGQSQEANRAQDAAVGELDHLIATAQRLREDVLVGTAPGPTRAGSLVGMAAKVQREIDAMRAAGDVTNALTAALMKTPGV